VAYQPRPSRRVIEVAKGLKDLLRLLIRVRFLFFLSCENLALTLTALGT
jgi:hypothetical protein